MSGERPNDSSTIAFCPACGCEHPEASGLLDRHLEDLKTISALKAQLTKERQTSPMAKGVTEVFEHWIQALGKDPDRQKPDSKLGEKRQAKIRARLREGFTVDELKRAIDGLARMPYVAGKGRAAEGSAAQLYDDLTIPLADETTVPRFIGYLETPATVTPLPAPKGLGPDLLRRPLDRAVVALRREFGVDAVYGDFDPLLKRMDCWWSVCPVQPGPLGHPMRLREKGGVPGGSLVLDCVHGCLPTLLLEAIWRLEAKRTAAKAAGLEAA